MAAQKTARASPELRKGSTQPALPSVLHHHPGHKLARLRIIPILTLPASILALVSLCFA